MASLDNERANDSHQHDNGVIDTAIGAGASNALLEDCMYYADKQYYNNAGHGLQSMQKADGFVDDNSQDVPPAQAIQNGPLRWVWGPLSPSTKIDAQMANSLEKHRQSESPSQGNAGSEQENEKAVLEVNVAHQFQEQTASYDTVDRLVLRRVTMLRCFFLITADVLGPFQGPYVFSQVGYVPGAIVYVIMGIMAFIAGVNLNVLYLRLDSDKMPVRNYGYLVHRIWGWYGKVITDFFFIIQLIFQMGELLLTNSQSLGLIIDGSNGGGKHHVCFSVLVVIFMVINLLFSPMRSLKTISWLSMWSLFLAICAIIITTTFVYRSGTPYAQAAAAYGPAYASGPVITSAIVKGPLSARVNGIMNMVYAYGGAQIFIDLMSEMKAPHSFYKAQFMALLLIMTIYLVTGIVIYARQGQFVQSLYYFGVNKYSYQTVGNAIGIYTGLVAAILYGNIVQKQFYNIVVRTWCKGPGLMTRQAYKWWLLGNLIVWVLGGFFFCKREEYDVLSFYV